MLHFELELMDLQKGVPEGYLFVWVEDAPLELFQAMDINQNGEVPIEEVCHLPHSWNRLVENRWIRPSIILMGVIKYCLLHLSAIYFFSPNSMTFVL